MLVIDEADSLLADRRDAVRSWEITQVNEMLTCLEDFQGLFVASTNLMTKLDAASARRLKSCTLPKFWPDTPYETLRLGSRIH